MLEGSILQGEARKEIPILSYPVRLILTETGAVKAIFPDVPEAVAEGGDEKEALDRAKDVLELILSRCLQEHGKIPSPSEICGAPTITTDMFVIQQTAAGLNAPLSGGRY